MTTPEPTAPPTTVLVTGATGRTGRLVVAGLLDAGVRVRALVRNPLVAGLPADVDVVQGDLTDPAAVGRAADGADAAFLLWPGFTADGAADVVDALAAHVRHVVYLSAADLRADGPAPVAGVWADVEDLVARAPVTHVFVRGGGFAVNTLEWAPQIRAGDTVRIPYPGAGRSLVDERDLADVSVRGLLDPALAGAALAVTGPATLTQEEQVLAVGAALGRDLVVEEQPLEEARRAYADAMSADYADTALAYWATLVDRPEPPADDVERVLGRPARTFAGWAAYHADDFRALSAAEVGRRYADGFRTGDVEAATRMLDPDVVRVAPLETGGEPVEVRGLAAIAANAERQNTDVEIEAVDVGEPLVGESSFAIRFSFHERRRDTGAPRTTTKVSLCTVTAGRITREEVCYFTPAHT